MKLEELQAWVKKRAGEDAVFQEIIGEPRPQWSYVQDADGAYRRSHIIGWTSMVSYSLSARDCLIRFGVVIGGVLDAEAQKATSSEWLEKRLSLAREKAMTYLDMYSNPANDEKWMQEKSRTYRDKLFGYAQ